MQHDLATLDKAVNTISDSLYKSANILIQPLNQDNERSTQDYDPLIIEAERVHLQWSQNHTNTDVWQSVREEMVTHLKKNVAGKERQAWMTALNEKDPKILWKKINWKGAVDPPRNHLLKNCKGIS